MEHITETIINFLDTPTTVGQALITGLLIAAAAALIACLVEDAPWVTWEEDGVKYAWSLRRRKHKVVSR